MSGIEGLGYKPISQLPDGGVTEADDTAVVVRLGVTRKVKVGTAASRNIGTGSTQVRDNALLDQSFTDFEVDVDDKFESFRITSDSKYFQIDNDLSEVSSPSNVRLNIGLGDASTRTVGIESSNIRDNTLLDPIIQDINDDITNVENSVTALANEVDQDFTTFRNTSDSKYLHVDNDLSDVNSVPDARTNLSVYSKTEVEVIAQDEAFLAALLYG